MEYLFNLYEVAILNEHVKTGLPNRVGELVKIYGLHEFSPNYDYVVELDNGDLNPVKESELLKLTGHGKELITYIYTGNSVIYAPANEVVIISKVDYLHDQAEINFLLDGGSTVVGFETLRKIELESDSVVELGITRADLHRDVIEEIHETFKIKNADYGNSFGEQYEEYGLLSALIRLDDKMRRLKQLTKQEAQVKDESIRDTILDLANYAIMTVMELDK